MANKQSKIRKEIGEKFRNSREKLGLTQVEVADKTGIDRRLKDHNSGKSTATRNKKPWKLIHL